MGEPRPSGVLESQDLGKINKAFSTALTGIYETLPVDGNIIRLFFLHPSSDAAADIEFSLWQADLAASEGYYEALSYTWGELHSTRRIFLRRIGSRLPVDIRKNLYDCLLRLRRVELSRTLWIDAICINQDDLTEKGQQITLMPCIYSGAEQVLAWLGEAANDSEIFSINQGKYEVGTVAFFHHPYWERTWIIQELLNARAITFQCGRYRISPGELFEIIPEAQRFVRSKLTGYGSRARNLVLDKIFIKGLYRDRDGGFSRLLANHSESKCANKLDIVYALLGILPDFAPALKIPLDYAATTTQLYIRAIDQMDTPARHTGENAAEGLKRALDLTWLNIIAAMQETENLLDVSKCHFTQLLANQIHFSIVDECCLTGGDPTHKPPQFYTRNFTYSSAPRLSFMENLYTGLRRLELSRVTQPEQRPVWAIHGSVRRGDLLSKCYGSHCGFIFALVFRPGTDETWACIGCAWKLASPEADHTPAESRAMRGYIVSSGLFLHACLQVEREVTCLIRAPSRLFALTQGVYDFDLLKF